MTKTQLDKKFREIAKQVPAMLREFKRAALASGAIDLPSAGDDFILPKTILTAALLDAAHQWGPKTIDDKEVRNIRACSYPDYTRSGQ